MAVVRRACAVAGLASTRNDGVSNFEAIPLESGEEDWCCR